MLGSHVIEVTLVVLESKGCKLRGIYLNIMECQRHASIHSISMRSQLLKPSQRPQLLFPHQQDIPSTVNISTSFWASSIIFKTSLLSL